MGAGVVAGIRRGGATAPGWLPDSGVGATARSGDRQRSVS